MATGQERPNFARQKLGVTGKKRRLDGSRGIEKKNGNFGKRGDVD